MGGLLGAGIALAAPLLVLPPVALPEPPGPVLAWFAEEGVVAATTSESSGLSAEELTRLAVGTPINVGLWSEDFLAGVTTAEPVVASGEWVAPVTLDGAGLGAIVAAAAGDGAVADHRVLWDEDLGYALVSFLATTFILDEGTTGWFRLGGDVLTPVTAEAKDVLAGSIDVRAYQPFLVERYSTAQEEEAVPSEGGGPLLRPVAITAAAVVALLALVGVIVWVRRPEAPNA